MQAPRIDGLRVTDLTGAGPCGNVYGAHDESDTALAVKVFHGLSINRPLLAKMTSRLEAAGWPAGVMQVVSADFESRPALMVMPWMADPAEDGHGVPRTLQNRLADYPGERSWPVVLDLARALATFHDLQVAHGNLKPSNVFFDDTERLSLSDWTLGNMPGVTHADYSDAYLYQSPEQLRDPDGYLEEKGYRWDVFTFAVLAFRLVTGRFPRCNDTFIQVAPPPGEIKRENIHADLSKIARKLEGQPEVTWPDEPANPVEAGYREWIIRCLALDPAQRPATMAEVARGFEAVEQKATAEGQREQLLNQRRRADHRAWRSLFAAGAAIVAALLLGGLWQISAVLLRKEKARHKDDVAELNVTRDAAIAARDASAKTELEARQALNHERDVSLARIQASRTISDHLFEWAMEKGRRQLPPLDGRELRLLSLQRFFQDFLITADPVALDEERARVKLELAEVSLSRGDAELAKTRLEDALDAWKARPTDASWKLRIGTDRLLLALLRQSKNDPTSGIAFKEARQALNAVPQADVDADRLQELLAVLDFHEAQLLSSEGDDPKALEQLMRATQTLNRLTDQRPDVAVLRSDLANCYLSSATILEGIGSIGDAREVRNLAASELIRLLKDKPGDAQLRLDLAGCYGGMAEAAVLAGDVSSADTLSAQATGLLEALMREQPDNADAASRLGAQRWIRAGLLRDRGKADEAMKMADDGIRILEGARASDPSNGSVCNRLALLWWQKGKMLGTLGHHEDELVLITKARDTLSGLANGTEYGLAHGDQLKKSLAYIMGDLGHAELLDGKNADAKKTFSQAVALWEGIMKSRPQNEEADEALSWCRLRLKEIQ